MQTLKIQDLPASLELDREGMSAVRGGNSGNSNVSTLGQIQNVYTPVYAASGAGSAQNVDVYVDAYQYGEISNYQNIGDKFKIEFPYEY